jgi:hypothetical protein
MPYALKTPLDLKKVELSAAFFRTHLGHRENATELAIGLIRKGVETERASAGDDPFEIECTESAISFKVAMSKNIIIGRRR